MTSTTVNTDEILETLAAYTILYPDFCEAMRLITKCFDTTRHRKDPASAMLIGSTGVGKTRLCRMIEKQLGYARKVRDVRCEHIVKPCLYVELPESATIKSLSMVLARELGANPNDHQSVTTLETLIIERLDIMQVKLVILDDFHHIAEKGQSKTKYSLCSWISILLNKSGVPFLLSGTSAGETIVNMIQELSDRFPYRAKLKILPITEETSSSSFIGILSGLQKELIRLGDLQKFIHLTDPNHYIAVYLPTQGNFRKLSNLLHDGFRISLLRGDHTLTLNDFAEAADDLAFCCSPNYFRMSPAQLKIALKSKNSATGSKS